MSHTTDAEQASDETQADEDGMAELPIGEPLDPDYLAKLIQEED